MEKAHDVPAVVGHKAECQTSQDSQYRQFGLADYRQQEQTNIAVAHSARKLSLLPPAKIKRSTKHKAHANGKKEESLTLAAYHLATLQVQGEKQTCRQVHYICHINRFRPSRTLPMPNRRRITCMPVGGPKFGIAVY